MQELMTTGTATGHFAGKPSIRGRLWSECKETRVWIAVKSSVCVCVCVARGDDKAIKPHMSNINCFDLFSSQTRGSVSAGDAFNMNRK